MNEIVQKQWADLSDDDKAVYEKLAVQDRRRYETERAEYVLQLLLLLESVVPAHSLSLSLPP